MTIQSVASQKAGSITGKVLDSKNKISIKADISVIDILKNDTISLQTNSKGIFAAEVIEWNSYGLLVRVDSCLSEWVDLDKVKISDDTLIVKVAKKIVDPPGILKVHALN